jgi:hypothetical protein
VAAGDQLEHETAWRQRPLTRLAATGNALSAGLGAASLGAKLVFEKAWPPLLCGDSRSVVLDILVLAALAFSLLAVVLGVCALVGGSRHKASVAMTLTMGAAVGALILIPDALGGYQCMTIAT